MGYDIFKFGALYLGNEVQQNPQRPTKNGDVPLCNGWSTISIRTHPNKKPITWIKPSSVNLLIADRVLLCHVNWFSLDKSGFAKGQEIEISERRFRCRLLQVGKEKGVPNEWDRILNETGENDDLWHWENMFFWGANTSASNPIDQVVRGNTSARNWDVKYSVHGSKNVGFRPVLEPLPTHGVSTNCKLDGEDFFLSSIPCGEWFYPILQPIKEDVFANIPDHQQIRMYTLLKNGQPVRTDAAFPDSPSNTIHLEMTDRYFGDEYLISWVVSNGIAVASQSLQKLVLGRK